MERECRAGHRLEEGEPLRADHLIAWKSLWLQASQAVSSSRMALNHVTTGDTRAAYDHGKKEGPCTGWRLDHILYSPRELTLRQVWAALEADPVSLTRGLPNHNCPSDHLPIAAGFAFHPSPQLESAAREALLGRVHTIEASNRSRWETLANELAQGQAQVEAQVSGAPAAATPAVVGSGVVSGGVVPMNTSVAQFQGATPGGLSLDEIRALTLHGTSSGGAKGVSCILSPGGVRPHACYHMQRKGEMRTTQQPAAAAAASGSSEAVKNKGKKGGKPAPEVIAFIQERRRQERALKQELGQEREEFIAGLGELELDALEESAGCSLEEWVGQVAKWK